LNKKINKMLKNNPKHLTGCLNKLQSNGD